ncbi:BLUF domain-containing protein [Hymenobacter sp. BRD128]|uniref:BLUF domain-containing protein n=1 Tax=Hymenobacter sp. BRD128 TaxID=2675878 RepID=UPI001565DA8C|nr:BLUF domain-containing protein [Hymenobacter sp. BRD128]QKG55405.1 BLUF domain-containing protein [Hymenobacter sp. BRD128]
MPLYHLIYESRASQPFTDADLLELLRNSRDYNAQHELTGLLLYSAEGRFLQVLEGRQAAVLALYQRISQDVRHTACMLLLSGPLAERRFGEWRMGYRATRHHTDLPALLGHVDTSSPDFLLPLLPKLSTSLLDRLFDYVHHTPAHASLDELVAG